MSKVHKENGGYIGIDYRQASPSGIYVLGGVGRVSEVTIDVELYGGKGSNWFRAANVGAGYGGNGGYTKFRLLIPSTKILQIRPNYMSSDGGVPNGVDGGDGAGLLVENYWLGVAGGGGGGGGRYLFNYTNSSFSNESANNGGAGSGGYGTGNPSIGISGVDCGPYYDNPSTPTYVAVSQSGAGGGGAAGGGNGGSACFFQLYNPGPIGGGTGGSGNLRIYKDQATTSGYLSVLPDVYMEYTTHSNGTHTGGPQVKITNVASGQNYTYTSSTDIGVSFIAADIFVP